MTAIAAGTATNAGKDGVDLYVALHGALPNSYGNTAQKRCGIKVSVVKYGHG